MRYGRMALGFGILTGLYLGGEWLMQTLRLPFPGSLAGLLLCSLLLSLGVLPLGWVEEAAGWLLRHMALFFLPLTAGIIVSWDLIRSGGVAIILAVLVSTMLVLGLTGAAGGLLRLFGRAGRGRPASGDAGGKGGAARGG